MKRLEAGQCSLGLSASSISSYCVGEVTRFIGQSVSLFVSDSVMIRAWMSVHHAPASVQHVVPLSCFTLTSSLAVVVSLVMSPRCPLSPSFSDCLNIAGHVSFLLATVWQAATVYSLVVVSSDLCWSTSANDSWRTLCNQSCLCVCLCVCLHVCLCVSVSRITARVISRLYQNVVIGAYQSEEVIDFWWWSSPGYGFWITFTLSLPLQNRAFQEIYYHFS